MGKRQGGGDASGGHADKLDVEGVYHFIIDEGTDMPLNRDNSPVNNADFRIKCKVVCGLVAGQEEKNCDITFFHPKSDSKDGGDFTRKKADRFFIAANYATPKQIEDKDEFDVDWEKIGGRQFIARMKKAKDPKYLEIDGADAFHVDDPAVKPQFDKLADQKRRQEFLRHIPPAQRWPNSQPPGSGTPNPAASKPAGSKPSAPLDEVP